MNLKKIDSVLDLEGILEILLSSGFQIFLTKTHCKKFILHCDLYIHNTYKKQKLHQMALTLCMMYSIYFPSISFFFKGACSLLTAHRYTIWPDVYSFPTSYFYRWIFYLHHSITRKYRLVICVQWSYFKSRIISNGWQIFSVHVNSHITKHPSLTIQS